MATGRFAIATHALALLAGADDGHSSEFVAESVNTHPVFLRRIMASLTKAGLVRAREGRGGGYRLSRAASKITLADVYAAVEPSGPIAPSPCEPSRRCSVGSGMRAAFEETALAASEALRRGLAKQTIAGVAARAHELGRGRRAR